MRYGSGSQSISDTQNSGTIESHVYNNCEIQMTPSQSHSSDTESAEGETSILFNLPRRNENFVDREVEFQAIKTAFSDNEQVLYVLHGLGGVGKTQLANAFLLKHQQDYQLTVRIRAEQIENLRDDLIKLGEHLDIMFHKRKRKDKAVETINYLSNTFIGKMLLLYDNVVSYDEVKNFIPTNPQQHVLITSKNRNGWDSYSSREVKSMSKGEAASLLEQLVGEEKFSQETKVAAQLVEELGCLPLAIAQAGVYIKQRSTTITQYLELYQNHKKEIMDSEKPADYDSSVYVTFDLNIQYLQQKNPLALLVLDCCSYCDAEDIPEWFLKELFHIDAVTFNESKRCLNQFSLVDFEASKKTASMHRVLQAVRREKHLEDSNSETLTSLLSWLAANYTYDYNDRNFSEYCGLLPHVSSIVDFIDSNNEKQNELPDIDIKIYYALGLFYLDYEYDAEKAKGYFDRAISRIDTLSDDRLKAKIHRQYAKTLFRINPDDPDIPGYYKSASDLNTLPPHIIEFDQLHQKFQKIISSRDASIRHDIDNLEEILQALNALIRNEAASDEANYFKYTQLRVILALLEKIERVIELRERDCDQLEGWKTNQRRKIESEISELEQKRNERIEEAIGLKDKLLEELDDLPPKIRAQYYYQVAKFQFCHHKTGEGTLRLIKNAWALRAHFQEDYKMRMLNLYSDILYSRNRRRDAIQLLETVQKEFSSDNNKKKLQKKIRDIKSQSSLTDLFASGVKKISDTVRGALSSGSSAAADGEPLRPETAPPRYRQSTIGGLFNANSTSNSRKRRSTDSKNNERSVLKPEKKIQRVSSQDSASYS